MNEHATAVIDAYLEADNLPVPHALFLEGPWGSGKTYFLENIYEPRRQELARAKRFNQAPFLFVSLFGATSAADVEKRMHRAASPREVAIGKAAGTVITGFFEFLKIKDAAKRALDEFEKKASRRHVDYILIFDDLERVEEGALGEIMGLVNSFITTHKRRVILVGDEAKLLEIHAKANWKEQNEKIVGRRVRIEPNIESVIQTTILTIGDPATKAFMTERLVALGEMARRSDVANLRNLSWAIVNGARFARSLLSDSEIPPEHVTRTMLVVVAATLWYRSGKLDKAALDRLPNLSMTLMARSIERRDDHEVEDPETTEAKLFSETFADLAVDSPPLEYKCIIDFEGSGILNDTDFVTWTKSQFGFGQGRSEPSWRRLWYSYERPMSETDAAVNELRDELTRCIHTQRGPILHAAGLALKHRKAGDRRLTNDEEVVPFFKKYIDGLVEMGTLEAYKNDRMPLDYDQSGSLGFNSNETPEFAEIAQYLGDRQAEMLYVEQKGRAEAIIKEAEAGDVEALYKLNMTNDELSRNPVLIDIDVDRMANLITMDVPVLNIGARLLAYRYHNAIRGELLFTEITWARNVYKAVLQKLAGWPEPHRSMATEMLQGLIRHYEQGHHADDQIIPIAAGAGETIEAGVGGETI